MPFRHYLSLFVIAMAICAALLVLAFEERIAGDSSGGPLAINPTGTNTPAGTCDTTYGPMTNKVTSILHGGRIEKVTSSWQQGGNTGLITTGTYNRDTGIFRFSSTSLGMVPPGQLDSSLVRATFFKKTGCLMAAKLGRSSVRLREQRIRIPWIRSIVPARLRHSEHARYSGVPPTDAHRVDRSVQIAETGEAKTIHLQIYWLRPVFRGLPESKAADLML